MMQGTKPSQEVFGWESNSQLSALEALSATMSSFYVLLWSLNYEQYVTSSPYNQDVSGFSNAELLRTD